MTTQESRFKRRVNSLKDKKQSSCPKNKMDAFCNKDKSEHQGGDSNVCLSNAGALTLDKQNCNNQLQFCFEFLNKPFDWKYQQCPKCNKCTLLFKDKDFFCINCPYVSSENNRSWVDLLDGFVCDIDALNIDAGGYNSSFDFQVLTPKKAIVGPAFNGQSWELGAILKESVNNKVISIWMGWNSNGNMNWFCPHKTRYIPMTYINTSDNLLCDGKIEGHEFNKAIMVVNVEDFISLIKSGFNKVICLPLNINLSVITSPEWKFTQYLDKQKIIQDGELITFAFPEDKKPLENELGRRFSKDKCQRVKFFLENISLEKEEKNIASVYTKYGKESVIRLITSASFFPVAGIHELNDMQEAFDHLYHHGLQPGEFTGWPSLDQFYTVKQGQWTLVTGIPGHGKSSWLDGLLLNLAQRSGWRIGVFSPENQPPERYYAGLMEKLLNKQFNSHNGITIEEKQIHQKWLNDKFKVILPSEDDGDWRIDSILNLAKTLVKFYGIKGLVIDPWNELDHSDAGDKEVSYLSKALTKVRRFARLYDVHVWLVAHPTKLHKQQDGLYPVPTPYDVAGGAHWRNKADNIISVYRFVGMEDQDITDLHIQKIRFKEVGKVGVAHLRTFYKTGHWVDDVDYDRREYNIEKNIHENYKTQIISQPRSYQINFDDIQLDDTAF